MRLRMGWQTCNYLLFIFLLLPHLCATKGNEGSSSLSIRSSIQRAESPKLSVASSESQVHTGSSPLVSPSNSHTYPAGRIIRSPSSAPTILHPSKLSPVISPVPHEVQVPNTTNPHPLDYPPLISPALSNSSHAPLVPQPPPSISPVPHEVVIPNVTYAPKSSQYHPSKSPPVISPSSHEVNNPPNSAHAPLVSEPPPSAVPITPIPHSSKPSPAMSPLPHEVVVPNVTKAHPSISPPVVSPPANEVNNPSNSAQTPLVSQPPPSTLPLPANPHSHSSVSPPIISPSANEVNNRSNSSEAPLVSQPPPSTLPTPPIPSHSSKPSPTMSPLPHEVVIPNVTHAPVISPSANEVNNPSNTSQAPLVSQPPPATIPVPPIPSHSSKPSPTMSPLPHEVVIPNVTQAPVISPSANEVNNPSNSSQAPLISQPPPATIPVPPIPSHSSKPSPTMSPLPHDVVNPNITHAPDASHSHSSVSPPVISPPLPEANSSSNAAHAPMVSQPPPHSSDFTPTISPIPHEVVTPNVTHAPMASNSHPPEPPPANTTSSTNAPLVSQPPPSPPNSSDFAPTISPIPHEVVVPNVTHAPASHESNSSSNNAHAPLVSQPPPSHSSEFSPAMSPEPHEIQTPNATHSHPAVSPVPHEVNSSSSPLVSQPPPSTQGPSSAPLLPIPHASEAPVVSPSPPKVTHAPMASHHPPESPQVISPSSAPIVSTPKNGTKTNIGNPAKPPVSFHPGRIISPAPSPETTLLAPPPINQGFVHAPSHPPEVFSKNNRSHHAPGHSPTLSPSRSISKKQSTPPPRPLFAFPPPPPNLDCRALTCMDPLTYPTPESLCVCVLPIKVGLRFRVAPYTFFPLISELAKEIAAGVLMKQSQVRIMGANADMEDPERTIVLVYLVPLGSSFNNSAALSVFDKFFHNQVQISTSYFGDYDVLYVSYPGLPPSPPATNYDTEGGAFNNGSTGIHPLAVDPKKKKRRFGGGLIAIIVLLSLIALVLSIGAAWILLLKCKRRSALAETNSPTSQPPSAKPSGTGAVASRPSSTTSASFNSSIAAYTGTAKTFSLAEMERATEKFSESRIIGEGGFGRVYKGILDDGNTVAVKVLKRADQQGGREFLAEVEMLSRLHHRNLVKLVGICTEESARCLVYELIPNGSVESHLHGTDKEIAPLDWNARIKIALGAARGLAYLHEDSSPRVIHRDFKSSNILLEHDLTPKVSDFGLARTAMEEGDQHITTRVMGTFGYVAPEYAMTGHLLVKSDVYSYGVVLLELLTGRKPVDMSQPPGQENLVAWALPLLSNPEHLHLILDPSLPTDIPSDSVTKVAAIASMCVQPEVTHRPFMSEVVQALKLVSDESESGNEAETSDTNFVAESCVSYDSIMYAGDTSGSFRRYANSGPLEADRRSSSLWQRMIGFSSGSIRRPPDLETSTQWP